MECPQDKCSFNGICVGKSTDKVGCQKCEECGCEPNMIDINCDRCSSCSRDEGELRWGSDGENALKQDEKIIEVEIK